MLAQIIGELGHRFPRLMHSCIIVNTPLFFENFFNQEVMPLLGESAKLVYMTGECAPKELIDEIAPQRLPKIYGGQCQCNAQCIYSEKGPWTDILNDVDY